MSQKEKKIREIINNPKNVRFLEIDKLLTDLGFDKRQAGKGSSHYIYSNKEVRSLIVLVSHSKNDILPEYQVKKALTIIKQMENK